MFLWLLTFYQTGPNGLFIFYQVFNLILQSAAIILIVLLLVKWQATYPSVAIIYSIYALVVIWFNVHFK